MKQKPSIKIDLSYDEGFRIKIGASDPSATEYTDLLRRIEHDNATTALEAFPNVSAELQRSKLTLEFSPDAERLRSFSQKLTEQDESLRRSLAGLGKNPVTALKSRFTPFQFKTGALLAFRGKAVLADPRSLEPVVSTIVACEIMRSHRNIARIIIVSPEPRHHYWQQLLEQHTGEHVAIVSGPRSRRTEIYTERSAFLIVGYEDLAKDRADIDRYSPQCIVLDDVSRYWGTDSKQLEMVGRLPDGPRFFVLSVDPTSNINGLFSVLQLLAPVVAGPKAIFESRYALNPENGMSNNELQSELRSRTEKVVIRRDPKDITNRGSKLVIEPRYVALPKNQRAVYDKSVKELSLLLEQNDLSPEQQQQANMHLTTLREACVSLHLTDPTLHDACKMDELRTIIQQEVIASGRKMIVFTRWEPMTLEMGEILKDLSVPFVRYYRKLTQKRRTSVLNRFMTESEIRIMFSTDTDMAIPGVQADVIVHFDMPWRPSFITWRHQVVSPEGGDVIALLAEDTIEISIFQEPRSDVLEKKLFIEEEQQGLAAVNLFAPDSDHLDRVHRYFDILPASDRPAAVSADDTVEMIEEEDAAALQMAYDAAHSSYRPGEGAPPAPSPAAPAAPPPPSAPSAATMPKAPETMPAMVKESMATDVMPPAAPTLSDAAPVEPMVPPMAPPMPPIAAPKPPVVEPKLAAVQEPPPQTSTPMAASEMPASTPAQSEPSMPIESARPIPPPTPEPKMAKPSVEPPPAEMHRAEMHQEQAPSTTEEKGAPEATSYAAGKGPSEGPDPVSELLDRLESPLRAVNHLIAGIPVVGAPISEVNGILWGVISDKLKRR